MRSPFRSSLLICGPSISPSVIYTRRCCLFHIISQHITNIIKVRDIYRIYVNTAMRPATKVEALENMGRVGHKHDQNVHRLYKTFN